MFENLLPRIISGFGFGFGMGCAMKIWNGLDRFFLNTETHNYKKIKPN